MPRNRGLFLKEDTIVQETFISERSRRCRKKLKVADMEIEHMVSAYKMQTTKIISVLVHVL